MQFNPEHIGPNLNARRKTLGMSQTELAEQIGVSQVFLSKWERGIAWPSVERLCHLCEALQCGPQQLLKDPAQAEKSDDEQKTT